MDKRSGSEARLAATAQPAARWWHPRQLAVDLSAGLLAGLVDIGVLISLAALIFSGPLTGFLANGIGLILVGSCLMNIVLALLSARPPMVIHVQDSPTVVVALVAASIVAAAPANSDRATLYATVVVATALTTVATGATFLLLGQLRLGSLVRYMPYPVVGGFLAGTGWLLLSGGISLLTGTQPSLADLPALFQPPLLWRWLPGVVFALILLLSLRRSSHALVLPSLLIVAAALFYGWLALIGVPLSDAQARGWLLGPFPDQVLWAPLTPAMLGQVNWLTIIAQSGALGAAVAICVVGLLLNVSGLQLARRNDIDLNQELRAAGFAQLAAGLIGCPPGFHGLSLSVLVHRLGARTRLAGIVVGLLCAGVFLLGADLLALVPVVVLGGLVCFLGLSFLAEWLYDAWFQLPRLDYVLIVLILLLVAFFGVLTGVVAGLAIAVVLFVVAYSRIDVVKHHLSGLTVKSRMTRSYAEQQELRTRGEQIAIFQLQGFLFFGTAHDLYERVRQRALAASQNDLRFVLLDFRLVPRLDSTAILSFTKMLQLAEARNLVLVFTQLAPVIKHQIVEGLLRGKSNPQVHIFADLDHGLEWCEAQLLADAGLVRGAEHALLSLLGPEPAAILGFFERRTVQPGEYLMRQGDQPEDMFFVESGQVTARIEANGSAPLRLETMGGGRMVGELGFFLERQRTAAVVADELSVVYRITRADLQRLDQEHPAAASVFHQLIARLLSERVVHLIESVDALQR